ncbi:hypothetical protein D6D04_07816 [Aureobasidium pullulans]|nr:hypothetical protein D6D04_07816 [Aureobasidium pullulans]
MKIFLLGATGYIGGDLLYLLNKTHPEVKIALGDNNSADVIAEEVAKADLIYPADHRNVDEIVLDLANAESERIKTAIVCPAVIYGTGRGPVKTSSLAIPFIAADVLNRGTGIAPEGEWVWGNVHVEDLSRLTLSLIEIAATTNTASNTALWGKDAYYFVEAGESDWADIIRQVVREAHEAGLVQSEEVKYLNKANAVEQGGPVCIEGTIREAVAAEASKLGML